MGQLSAYFEKSLMASKQAEAKAYLKKSPTNTQDAHAAAKFLINTQQKLDGCDCDALSVLTGEENLMEDSTMVGRCWRCASVTRLP